LDPADPTVTQERISTRMLLEDTVQAIREADLERRRRVAERRRLRRPVVRVDQILQELEEIHLRGGIKVPAVTIAKIERLLETLPPECPTAFPLRTTITRVMDHLYAIQDCLLSRKDVGRASLQVQDMALHPAAVDQAGAEVPLGVDPVQRRDRMHAQPAALAHLVAVEDLEDELVARLPQHNVMVRVFVDADSDADAVNRAARRVLVPS